MAMLNFEIRCRKCNCNNIEWSVNYDKEVDFKCSGCGNRHIQAYN